MASQPGVKKDSDRAHQRYDGDARLVCGCVPFRASSTGGAGFEVLLLASQQGDAWIFPKGGWNEGESAEQAAQREAWEEAGVRGDVLADLGEAMATSSKGNVSRMRFFLLHTSSEEQEYDEAHRNKKWASLAEAHELVTRPEMRLALNRASEWLASVGRERNPLKAICVVLLFAFCVWLLRPARGAVLTAAPIFLKRRRRL